LAASQVVDCGRCVAVLQRVRDGARCRTPLDARRAINNGIRENTFEFLDKKNVKFIPSQTNFFIMEVGRPALTFAKAMAKQKVFIVGPSGRRGRLKFG
jgi:histidinol-phosphate/aromatic aminotransferase/cobyric acid decarboxylase-like protein